MNKTKRIKIFIRNSNPYHILELYNRLLVYCCRRRKHLTSPIFFKNDDFNTINLITSHYTIKYDKDFNKNDDYFWCELFKYEKLYFSGDINKVLEMFENTNIIVKMINKLINNKIPLVCIENLDINQSLLLLIKEISYL